MGHKKVLPEKFLTIQKIDKLTKKVKEEARKLGAEFGDEFQIR